MAEVTLILKCRECEKIGTLQLCDKDWQAFARKAGWFISLVNLCPRCNLLEQRRETVTNLRRLNEKIVRLDNQEAQCHHD